MISGHTLPRLKPGRLCAVWCSRALALILSLACHAPLQAQEQAAEETKLEITPFSDGSDDWRTRELFTGALVTFYGQFSPSVIYYDDGAVSRTYAPVGNSNRTSRLGLRWHIRQLWDWEPVFRAEIGVTPRPSNRVNLDTSNDAKWALDQSNLRKLELILSHPKIGVLTLGQGSMATDNITEVDYSGTDVVAYSDVSAPAAAQYLRFADGRLSTAQIGDFVDNFDGLNITGTFDDGNHKLRARYDTHRFRGLVFSAAIGNEVLRENGRANADVALTYEQDLGTYKFASGVGYSWQSDSRILSGSMSVVHKPSRINLTIALGGQDDGGDFNYAKLGTVRSFWPVGDTAMSVDYYQGNDIYSAGSEARSIGLAIVQSFDRFNVQGYALLRHYSFDEPTADYLNSTALMTGIRWVF